MPKMCGFQRPPAALIPWHTWFVVMSADGSVILEYREALRLDE